MEVILDELINVRTGEPLDKELQKRTDFCQRQKEWRDAIHNFDDMFKMTKEQWLAFDDIEDIFLKYNTVCIETAYQLGYADGILIGMEQMPDGRKSVLSLDDMTNLISVYDSIRQLTKVLLRKMDEHGENAGSFKIFEYIFNVINNATCAEIKLLGEDETCDWINSVLSDDSITPRERAKQLLGL